MVRGADLVAAMGDPYCKERWIADRESVDFNYNLLADVQSRRRQPSTHHDLAFPACYLLCSFWQVAGVRVPWRPSVENHK